MSSMRENTISTLVMFVTIWGAVFAYNSFIGEHRDYKLKSEITAHFDQSIESIKKDIAKLPTHSDVENAQLKSMLYAKDTIDIKSIEDRRAIAQLQSKMDELTNKLNNVDSSTYNKNNGSVGSRADKEKLSE